MSNQKLFLITVFVIGFTLTNCNDCNCPEIDEYFDIVGINYLNHLGSSLESDRFSLEDGDEVSFANYKGIEMGYQVAYISSIENQNRSTYGSTGQLMACSCIDDGHEGSKNEALHGVTVITLNNFDQQFAQNDTINDLILVDGTPLASYVGSVSDQLIQTEFITLSLTKAPEANEEFQVRIIVELSTGEVYERTSPKVVLKS